MIIWLPKRKNYKHYKANNNINKPPAVLVLSGLDPSGGAGLCADIETLKTHNTQALPIATCLTAQNTQTLLSVQSVGSDLINQQIQCLLDDVVIAGIKIGLLSDDEQILCIQQWLAKFSNIPIVLDPIIRASSDNSLLNTSNLSILKTLINHCTLITPNVAELTQLTQIEDEQKAVKSLNVPWVLVTKTDVSTIEIPHVLYHHGQIVKTFTYNKLPHKYHGSGCTLSSAIVAYLAQGKTPEIACQKALDWTYQTLKHAYKLGKIQLNPNRT